MFRPKPLIFILSFLLFITINSISQTPIKSVVTNYQASSTGSTYSLNSKKYHFGNQSGSTNNIEKLVGFTLPNGQYYYNVFYNGTTKIRRENNNITTGKRTLVWMESSEGPGRYSIFPPYTDSMDLFFNGQTINKGTDNLFVNQGDGSGNNNNIERVDWIVNDGVNSNLPAESGFAIFERGDDNAHDPFCVAAITALDANGDPSAFGQILRVGSNNYGNLPNSALNWSILRKEENETKLYRTTAGNQKRGGVYISFTDLGVNASQTIYGYSLFGYDLLVNAAPADLVDFTNKDFFPITTSSGTTQGGIDLIAITGLFNTGSGNVLPVKYSEWDAVLSNETIILKWVLENETECKFIEVEKSIDNLTWNKIASLNASQQKFVDNSLEALNYYRLKLVDASGANTITPVKKIAIDLKNIFKLVSVYPTQQQINMNITSSKLGRVNITIYNAGGSVIATHTKTIGRGSNNISFENSLPKGIYIAEINNGISFSSKQFVISY
jgi:hypothetical protein